MWQSGSMASHGPGNPWMRLMGIVHKERGRGGGAHGPTTGGTQDA